MISYAQAREDVLLHRALRHVRSEDGFYIDVGGYDPDTDSVTRWFYDCGWRGINVEPGEDLFPRFVERRPRDTNLRVAVTDQPGEVVFHEVLGHGQLCTLERRFADMHVQAGLRTRSYAVPATTLTAICEQHAPDDIHFLKIDVEGHEHAVIRGMDFDRFRPWVMVIEATVPNRNDISIFGEWHDRVDAAGYRLAYTDVLNRYYVAQEHPELVPHFAVAADDYVYARILRERDEARSERDEARRKLGQAEERVRQLEASRHGAAA